VLPKITLFSKNWVWDYRALFRLSFNFWFFCRFDLFHRRKCTYSYTCLCFQTSSAFLVQNLSVWEIYLCWLISRSSFTVSNTLSTVVAYIFIKRCYTCSTIIKITYCRQRRRQGGAEGAQAPLLAIRILMFIS